MPDSGREPRMVGPVITEETILKELGDWDSEIRKWLKQMVSTQGKFRLVVTVGAVSLVAILGMSVMFADSESTQQSRETEALLYQLETNARRLNANEWEAIASLKIDPEL